MAIGVKEYAHLIIEFAQLLDSMFTDAYREYIHLQDIADDDKTDMESYHKLMEKCDVLQARYMAIADVAKASLDIDLYPLCENIDD